MTYYTLANADIIASRVEERGARLRKTKKNSLPLFILAGILIAFVGLYVFAINATVSGTYELRVLNKKVENLRNQNKILEIESAKGNALSDLESMIISLNLVAIDKIEYIDINKDASLAWRW